jgi:YD repeat-containing protein
VAAKTTYNNLGEATVVKTYADSDQDFEIDVNTQQHTTELRAKVDRDYDHQGRVYQTRTYKVDPNDDADPTVHLTSNVWYDSRGLVMKTADSNGLFSKIKYDGAGRAVASYLCYDTDEDPDEYDEALTVDGDTVIEQTKTIYDAGSRPVASLFFQRLETDTGTGELTAATAYATASVTWYDKADRATHVINFGHDSGDTRYIFNDDENGSLIDTDHNQQIPPDGIPDEADAWNNVTQQANDPREPNTSNDYIVAKYQYNDAGLLYRVTDNKEHVTETQYDLLGRTTKTIANLTGNGIVSETDTDENQTTVYIYDSAGRLVTLRALNPKGDDQDPYNENVENQDTRYLYESEIDRSWVTNVIYPDSSDTDGPYLNVYSLTRTGTTASVTTTTNHGYNTGDQVRITGADQAEYNGWFTIASEDDDTFTYTVSGSPATPATGTIEVKKLGADEVKTTYDRLGRKVTVTDQRGVVHTYTYDSAGRLASDAVTNTTLPSGVDGSVRRIQWAYDDLSRVSTVTSYDAATGGTAVNQVAYTYDSWGNVASSRQAHDGEVGENSPAVAYAYDDGASGNEAKYVRLTSVTYPSGRVVYYNYPADGVGAVLSRLSEIADDDDLENENREIYAQYTYLGAGTIVTVDHPAVGTGDDGLILTLDPDGDQT